MDENELQILVGEYYNSRFNIIRADRVRLEGVLNFRIVDEDKVVEIIKSAVDNASTKIGATIQKVILVLPSLGFKRFPLRVKIEPHNHQVSKREVAKAVSSSLNTQIDDDLVIVNSSIVKYYVNGVAARRLPEKDNCDELIVDIDLLCADKDLCYSYVAAVSKAGLKVQDITLNNYSICREAVLFEQSLVSNVVLYSSI